MTARARTTRHLQRRLTGAWNVLPGAVRLTLAVLVLAVCIALTIVLRLEDHPFALLYPFIFGCIFLAPRHVAYLLILGGLLAGTTFLARSIPVPDLAYEAGLVGLPAIVLLTILDERRSLEHDLGTTQEQMQIVRGLGLYALSHLPREEVIRSVTGYITVALDVDASAVLLRSEDGDTLAGYAMSNGGGVVSSVRPIVGTVSGDIYRTGQARIIDDVQQEPGFLPILAAHARSCVGVPIRLRQWTVGVLYIAKEEASYFGPDDVARAEAMADAAAFSLQLSRAASADVPIDASLQ